MPTEQQPIILLIEDDTMISAMYKTKFTMEKLNLVIAADGETGLKLAKERTPSVVLLDIILPKIDGFQVLQQMKADATLKSVPVVLLTNLGQESDIEKGKKLGADDYFVKANHPPADIVAKVKALLKLA